jgi:hypothetical protein
MGKTTRITHLNWMKQSDLVAYAWITGIFRKNFAVTLEVEKCGFLFQAYLTR